MHRGKILSLVANAIYKANVARGVQNHLRKHGEIKFMALAKNEINEKRQNEGKQTS